MSHVIVTSGSGFKNEMPDLSMQKIIIVAQPYLCKSYCLLKFRQCSCAFLRNFIGSLILTIL